MWWRELECGDSFDAIVTCEELAAAAEQDGDRFSLAASMVLRAAAEPRPTRRLHQRSMRCGPSGATSTGAKWRNSCPSASCFSLVPAAFAPPRRSGASSCPLALTPKVCGHSATGYPGGGPQLIDRKRGYRFRSTTYRRRWMPHALETW